MKDGVDLQPLLDHLCNSSLLTQGEAEKLVTEVIAYFDEAPAEFVKRRHRELKHNEGWPNDRIFEQIEHEMRGICFAAPTLSQRQLRRMIYG